MKKALTVLWNNVNILLCGICVGMAIVHHDWSAVGGWICAAIAWHQSNWQSRWAEECMSVNKMAIALLELSKYRRAEVLKVDDGEWANMECGCE